MAASTLLCLRLVALLALGCTAAVSARTVAPRGAALQDVMVEVSGAAHTASFPRPVAGPIQATAGDKLRVSFKLDGTLRGAHQVFLRLTHQESGEQAFYMFKEAKSSDAVAVSIDLSDDAANMLERRSGDYVAHVLVGDASLEHGLLYELAQVQLQLPPPQRAPEVPLYHRTLLHESDTTLRALPEIQHRFREPERRPPAIVSRAFTAIALAPFAVLLVGLLYLGVNLRGLPTGMGFLWVLGFHGSLGAILVLFSVYWLRLNMFETLGYLAPLTLSALVFGNLALRAAASGDAAGAKSKSD